MSENYYKLKAMLADEGLVITQELPEDHILVVADEERGITNLIIDLEDPIVIIEQLIFEIRKENLVAYKRLLQMNRELVHGAFALDETGVKVFYRDTLEIATLDRLELQSSINALSLAVAEHAQELLQLAGN